MTQHHRPCRLIRKREMEWLKANSGMQSHFEDKWPLYKAIAKETHEFYADKDNAVYDDMISDIEGDLRTYDFQLRLEAFCNAQGLNINTIRNIMARLLLSWPDLSEYPQEI